MTGEIIRVEGLTVGAREGVLLKDISLEIPER